MAESPRNEKKQRSKRIELVITPGRSLGPFRLGSTLWDTIHYLRERPNFFPSVELKYSQEEPIKYDFIIALPTNGINLRFDGTLQRMKSIECFDPTKIKLVYQNSDVSSSRTIPTFLLIYKAFGPTYPGEFVRERSVYTLKYPGLSFIFPIPARHRELYESSTDLPLEFPDGTTPIASHIYLFSNGSPNWQRATVPSLAKIVAEHNASTTLKYGKIGRRELESVKAQPGKEVVLHFPTHDSLDSRENTLTTSQVRITLQISTPQDILAELGKPSRIFYKEEDKMKIHSVTDDGAMIGRIAEDGKNDQEHNTAVNEEEEKDTSALEPTDYFFNYFHLGIDILMDGTLHVCKKVILHGNIPGHYDFQRYKRCPYQLHFPNDKNDNNHDHDPKVLVDVESDADDIGVPGDIVTADMKIDKMKKRIPWDSKNAVSVKDTSKGAQHKPVILTRGSSEQNPFGSTHLTGYDEGLVMEVMKNGHVPTIVLF
ncbi:hypothetical protein BDB00DRAFT_871756 [Zychaea mexicana]|uniref:uncharacterized protein n=1 Tax=Zychaea mexicana TaxID=64656 RepID=UPI0022FE6E8E|nr:uncharacterized protein BDB00DRAFT_871756 [Zychaea mexicana]KAI9493996.1 hypothetical protein BDB00DRAFT_871756 [Zychaea mexicana]